MKGTEDCVSDEEKLRVLEQNDPFREWTSLDETRFCILCEKTISGRDIVVSGGSGRPVRLSCPTPGCAGTPYEWVYLGDPLLSEEAFREWERITNAAAGQDHHPWRRFSMLHLRNVLFTRTDVEKAVAVKREEHGEA